MSELVALPYSPWSERARWSLAYHGIAVNEVEYVPMLGEPALRWRTRRPVGPVSVPVWIRESDVVFDSFAIARAADASSELPPLGHVAFAGDVEPFVRLGETALAAGRGLITRRILESPEALSATLPRIFPALVRRRMGPVARVGAHYIVRKYRVRLDPEETRSALRLALGEFRRALAGRETLLGRFSFADIALSTALQFVSPTDHPPAPLDPALAQAFTDPELALEFQDLLAWRDALVTRYRPR